MQDCAVETRSAASVDERCLVQTDYRALLTVGPNAAFGYNFGSLQNTS
jgi:hypothetical protein